MFKVAKKYIGRGRASSHINLGRNYVHIGKRLKVANRVKIEYDKEKNLLRITPDKNGYKINYRGNICATVDLPLGNYYPIGNDIYQLKEKEWTSK